MTKNRDILLRNVIREELVMLTMHRDEAAILGQFLYWTPRCKTYDEFLIEEKEQKNHVVIKLEHGWIYKSAEELKHELLMIDTNVKTVRKHLNNLIGKGYLFRRRNPVYKFDKTYQYRINLRAIVDAVNSLGHQLEGFEQFSRKINNVKSYYLFEKIKGHYVGPISVVPDSQTTSIESDNLVKRESEMGNASGKMSSAISEITTEITNKEYNTKINSDFNDNYKAIEEKFLILSSKSSVSKEEELLIMESLKLVNDVTKILTLMDDCYKLKISFANGAAASSERGVDSGIWSFKYFLNYIKKELDNEDEYGRTNLSKYEKISSKRISGEPDGEALHIGWLDDTKCDF